LQRSPRPLAELKGRGGERGRSGKWEAEGREWEMEEEGNGRRKGDDPQCLKCVDAHADLPIIKQLLMLWHSGSVCTGVPERQRLIKIVNKWYCAYTSDIIRLVGLHAAETGSV